MCLNHIEHKVYLTHTGYTIRGRIYKFSFELNSDEHLTEFRARQEMVYCFTGRKMGGKVRI
jgi:hypothetical protein